MINKLISLTYRFPYNQITLATPSSDKSCEAESSLISEL